MPTFRPERCTTTTCPVALATDIKSDRALFVEGHLGRAFELGDRFSASITGEARAESYSRYSGLNNNSLGASFGLRNKLGLGLTAPVLRYHLSFTRLDFDDAYRDGWKGSAGIAYTKRINEQWQLGASWTYDQRITDKELRLPPTFSGKAYDVKGNTLSIDMNYTASERWQFSAGYAQRHGSITSTGVHTQAIWDASTAWSKDFALGDDSYRINARTYMLNLGASYAVSDWSSINLSFARWFSRATGGFDYANNVFRTSFVYSFF